MISVMAMPYTFGFGISFNVGIPVVNRQTTQAGRLWEFNMLIGFIYIQVAYVG